MAAVKDFEELEVWEKPRLLSMDIKQTAFGQEFQVRLRFDPANEKI